MKVLHIIVATQSLVVCLICPPSALGHNGPRASGVRIRQTTHACVTTINCTHLMLNLLVKYCSFQNFLFWVIHCLEAIWYSGYTVCCGYIISLLIPLHWWVGGAEIIGETKVKLISFGPHNPSRAVFKNIALKPRKHFSCFIFHLYALLRFFYL